MRITSTSVTLGGRIMTSRCEVRHSPYTRPGSVPDACASASSPGQVTDKASGRMIASALLGKMQPKL